MDLFYREMGSGEPIVILHGLYGASDNWMSIGRELSKQNRVILVDQRNHGRSPHSTVHTYDLMVSDLHRLFEKLSLQNAVILGHSMGGKTASLFAYQYPQLLKGLVIADIIPFGLDKQLGQDIEQINVHKQIFSGLLSLDIKSVSNRDDLDSALSVSVPNKMVRQFLLKNVKREDDGSFGWMLNVEALSQNLESLILPSLPFDVEHQISVKTQFIKGEKSPYISAEGIARIGSYFSNYRVDVISNAGHWLHAENPRDFLSVLYEFLNSLNG
ncbi:MAG TPA: alpha/beta hydrolase [Bacteroidales bacterium]|jgi:pimeloyl-ACP methyl ester carboxylesterase|nr:alpha/beta hydrolase [Bacteroidales bacterium]